MRINSFSSNVLVILTLMTLAACNDHSATNSHLVWKFDTSKSKIKGSPNTSVNSLGDSIHIVSNFEKLPRSMGTTGGAYIFIPKEIEKQVSGKSIEVSVLISVPADKGSMAVGLAYATNKVGNSGWKRADIKTGTHRLSFRYNVPNDPQKGNGRDFIGILGDYFGVGGEVLLKGAEISIVE